MERPKRAVELAEALLREARAGQTSEERGRAERLARLMEDPRGKELTIALTDQCFRSRRPERIADQLHYLLERYGAPRFMEWWERIGLTLGALVGQYMPSLIVPPIVARLRQETEALILPGEAADLRRYLAERRADGIRLNLNQLGEAILGEEKPRAGSRPTGAPGPRRRRVHLGEGLLGVEPDRAHRVPPHRPGREGPAPRPLPPGAAASLPASGRARHAQVRQPRHGGVPRPRAHGHRLSRSPGRGRVHGAAGRHRAPGLSARVAPRAARARDLGDRAVRARRRVDQAARGQGRQPGDGADRGRSARLEQAPLQASSKWTQISSA